MFIRNRYEPIDKKCCRFVILVLVNIHFYRLINVLKLKPCNTFRLFSKKHTIIMSLGKLSEALQISHLAKQEVLTIKTEINEQNHRLMNLQRMNFCLRELLGTNDKNITELQKKRRYSIAIFFFLMTIFTLSLIFIKISFFYVTLLMINIIFRNIKYLN